MSGVTAGVATALLRNVTEAALTATVMAAAAVLAGIVSVFVPKDVTLAHRRRAAVAGLAVVSVLLVVMWVIIAWSYIGNASSSSQNAVGWAAFLGGIAAATVLLAVVVARHLHWPAGPVLTVGALYVFGAAVLGLLVLAATVLRTTARPIITTTTKTVDDTTVSLSATVTAAGLSTWDRYEITAELLDKETDPTFVDTRFRTHAGPDGLGDLRYTFFIELPRHGSGKWVGISARLGPENPSNIPVANKCGHAGLPKQGITCTLVRLP
ncbi:hypothetical protein ACIA8R_19475 [Nonomuraea sp. NPDC051191]|uniref:hypothetical protein n=1 Tax=Nonomuraea sp. NPDC051191 TaxID=3364372 RepID=UPI0037B8357A